MSDYYGNGNGYQDPMSNPNGYDDAAQPGYEDLTKPKKEKKTRDVKGFFKKVFTEHLGCKALAIIVAAVLVMLINLC